MKTFTVHAVDAFTKVAFKGNPAAVICTNETLSEKMYQSIAAEMALSETAFVQNLASQADCDFSRAARFGLRWFTPKVEVPLCGHATLASAYVLFNVHKNVNEKIEFETLSGVLVVRKEGDSIELDFPLNTPQPLPSDKETAQVMKNVAQAAVGNLTVQEVLFSASARKLLVRLDDKYSRKDLEDLPVPTDQLLKAQPQGPVFSVIVTLRGYLVPDGYHFYSRNFAPWVGIPEDPVTGSAHTVSTPYWLKVLNLYGQELRAFQCSPRGGELRVRVENGRVYIKGDAALVLKGELTVPEI